MSIRPKLKYLLVPISWVISISFLIILTSNNSSNSFYHNASNCPVEITPTKNQLGEFSYICRDPNQSSSPIYSVYLKNFLTENNKLGIFKTGLHKVARIQDLRLSLFQYSNQHSQGIPLYSLTSVQELMSGVKGLVSELNEAMDKKSGWRINLEIDLNNISEVFVNEFGYKIFLDNNLFLHIQSKRAIASYKYTGIMLRGHVTIKTADGNILESNCINWDIKKNILSVKGVYALCCNGVRTTGENICFDMQLNRIQPQQNVKSNQVRKMGLYTKL